MSLIRSLKFYYCLAIVSALGVAQVALPEPGGLIRVTADQPLTLDLRIVDPSTLFAQNPADPAQRLVVVRKAWNKVVAPVQAAVAVRLMLPRGERRLPMLLATCQALKASNPRQAVYLGYDPEALPLMDEMAWGALDGGFLTSGDLGPDASGWEGILRRAQAQLPGCRWYLMGTVDPQDLAGSLLGDGGRLMVPVGGPTARLAAQIPAGFTEVEGGRGDLTLRNPGTGETRRWRYQGGEWRGADLPRRRNLVEVVGKDAYDVAALVARVRATQLRQGAAMKTLEFVSDDVYHGVTSTVGTSEDWGGRYRYFSKVGEPNEFRQEEVTVNGVRANLKGKAAYGTIVEATRAKAQPLELSLTERYRYLDGGPGAKAGQRWVRFEPVDGDATLSHGDLLVEEAQGRILQERSQRSNLPGSVKSLSQTLTYGESAPGFWTLLDVRLVARCSTFDGIAEVRKHSVLKDFKINDPAFEIHREAARDSEDAMYRSTPAGIRYLVPQASGTRKAEDALPPTDMGQPQNKPRIEANPFRSQWALYTGIQADPAVGLHPNVGLGYSNNNLLGRGIMASAITALIYNEGNIQIPGLFWGVDLKSDVAMNLIRATLRPTKNGVLQDRDAVALKTQNWDLGLARELGAGFRVSIQGQLEDRSFSEPSQYGTPGFVLPQSGVDQGLSEQLTWQAHGLQFLAASGQGKRPSGSYGDPSNLHVVPDHGRYRWWQGSAKYDLDLDGGKWLNFTLGDMAGSGYDRFESITISGLGAYSQVGSPQSVNALVGGIRSSAIAADRMVNGEVAMVIPTGPKLRLTFRLDYARLHSINDGKYYGFGGLDTVGDLPGFGWFTTVRVDLGIGLISGVSGTKCATGSISLVRVF